METVTTDHIEAHEAAGPGYLVVEVGPGANPLAYTFPESFTGDRHYIGIENGARGADLAQVDDIMRTIRRDENIQLLEGDGSHLPLLDQSADEIIFSNVFGDPRVAGTEDALLQEALRVMKPAGSIIVAETTTPHPWTGGEIAAAVPEAHMASYKPGDPEWPDLKARYIQDAMNGGTRADQPPWRIYVISRLSEPSKS